MKQSRILTALLAATPLLAPALEAQSQTVEFPKASPSSLSQEQVGLTKIEIAYARPSAKGRKIFGGLVAFDEVWRTGANEATRITFGTDVEFGGQAVPAGSYALFTIPGPKQWTVILSKVTGQWGSYAYDKKDDLVRVKVAATQDPTMCETLTIGLGEFKGSSAALTIAWEHTRVAVPIETDLVTILVPQIEAAMSSDAEDKPYLEAAMFYYEHDLDLMKAKDWVEAAAMLQPEAMWVIYRKGLVLAKVGDKQGAMAAAKRSWELADKTGGPLGAEYKRLNETLLAGLQ